MFHLKQKPHFPSVMLNKVQRTLCCHSTSMWISVHLTYLQQHNMEQYSFSDIMMLLQAVHSVYFNRAQLHSLQQVATRLQVCHRMFALNHCHYTSNTCNCMSNWPLRSEREGPIFRSSDGPLWLLLGGLRL